mgnify:CR=1 FL=1
MDNLTQTEQGTADTAGAENALGRGNAFQIVRYHRVLNAVVFKRRA